MAARRTREFVYWSTQLLGWGLYTATIVIWNHLQGGFDPGSLGAVFSVFAIGVGISHTFRSIIRRQGWLRLGIGPMVLRLLPGSFVLGLLAFALQASINDVFLTHMEPILPAPPMELLSLVLNWTVLLLLWSFGYFTYHFFIQSRREEVRNLRLETANREGQLGNLRAQLNPHFMFNALNGIRALVDEDPALAKQAITQLSAILRNAMSSVRRKVVPLGEEIDIVKAYLALEAMRYEERLRVSFDVDPALEREPVPPMLLQTLVENAVRHGIATLPGGGDLHIVAAEGPEGLVLTIRNSGTYRPGTSKGNGIGLRNTRRRLELIYGPKASLKISERNEKVVTEVVLPRTKQHESTDHRR